MPSGERLAIARCAPNAVRIPPPSKESQLSVVRRRELSWPDHLSRDSFMSRLENVDLRFRCRPLCGSFVQDEGTARLWRKLPDAQQPERFASFTIERMATGTATRTKIQVILAESFQDVPWLKHGFST